jgi:hypothetical protein
MPRCNLLLMTTTEPLPTNNYVHVVSLLLSRVRNMLSCCSLSAAMLLMFVTAAEYRDATLQQATQEPPCHDNALLLTLRHRLAMPKYIHHGKQPHAVLPCQRQAQPTSCSSDNS